MFRRVRSSQVSALALLSSLSLLAAGFIAMSVPATATSHRITIVSTGGSAEGSGWSYASGEITAASDVSINASDVVGKLDIGNLTLDSAEIVVNSSVQYSGTNSLTLKATGNINFAGGVIVSTNGGDVVLHSDSNNSGVGSIRLGQPNDNNTGQISTSGGNLILGGGTDPLADYAMASPDFGTNPNKPRAGVAIFGFSLNSGAGNISVSGSSGAQSSSTRAVLIEANLAGRAAFTTTGSGTITIDGDGSQINFESPWGPSINGLNLTTAQGNIFIKGKADSRASNVRGVTASNMIVSSTSGDVIFQDVTDGSIGDYRGLYVGGTTTSITTGGNIVIAADEYQADGTLELVGPSAVLRPYTSSSFTGAITLGRITASACQNLVIGVSGNTSNLTVSHALSVGGPITMHGSTIALNQALTATSSTITLHASTAVTQTHPLTATSLSLNGAGAFTLTNANNNVGTLSGGSAEARLGNVTLTDVSGGLTIGQISSQTGLYSSGTINVATTSGSLTISQPVSSSKASGDSVLLYANKSATQPDAGDGDVIVSGSGSLGIESGARALVYSGSRATSTGLVVAVGGEDNTRSLVDSSTSLASITPEISSTGTFALFRTSVPSPAEPEPTPPAEPEPTPPSNPQVSPPAQPTPSVVVNTVSPRKVTMRNQIVTLSGANFQGVSAVFIGGVEVRIVSKSATTLRIRPPLGLSGSLAIEIRSSLGNLKLPQTISFSVPRVVERLSVAGFGPDSSKLTRSMKSAIRVWVNRQADLKTLRCTGFTALPRTSGDAALATQRGAKACRFAKRVRADLKVVVSKGIQDQRFGSSIRRVGLSLTP
jgi:hypothetical protein